MLSIYRDVEIELSGVAGIEVWSDPLGMLWTFYEDVTSAHTCGWDNVRKTS